MTIGRMTPGNWRDAIKDVPLRDPAELAKERELFAGLAQVKQWPVIHDDPPPPLKPKLLIKLRP